MSVYVAVPYTRPFYGSFIDSLLHSNKPDLIIWQRLFGYSVDSARNALMKWFKEDPRKPEYLLFIDNDATWHVDSIMRLIAHNLPMVCAGMYTKDLPPSPTWGKYLGVSKDGKHIYRYGESARRVVQRFRAAGYNSGKDITDNAMVLPETKDSLWEIDGCGMHFTLIRRDVVEALPEPWFMMNNTSGAGEDFWFCRNVRDAGFPIYVDETIHTGHSLGEGRTFGVAELLDYTQYVDDLDLGLADDLGTWEVD